MTLEILMKSINIMHIGGVTAVIAIGLKDIANDKTLVDKVIIASNTAIKIGFISYNCALMKHLKKDEKLIEMCINNGGFSSCPHDVTNSKKWCLMAIEKNTNSYRYCSDAANKNKEIVLLYLNKLCDEGMYKSCSWNKCVPLQYIPKEVYEDEDVANVLFKFIS